MTIHAVHRTPRAAGRRLQRSQRSTPVRHLVAPPGHAGINAGFINEREIEIQLRTAMALLLMATGAASAAGAGVDWVRSSAQLEHHCEGKERVRLEGAGNHVFLTGSCGPLIVEGAGNVVMAQHIDAVEVEGAGNTIRWRGRPDSAPRIIKNEGARNRVAREGGRKR